MTQVKCLLFHFIRRLNQKQCKLLFVKLQKLSTEDKKKSLVFLCVIEDATKLLHLTSVRAVSELLS
jgi:hypothetical protein